MFGNELHDAIHVGDYIQVQTLVESGASVNCLCGSETPLSRALRSKHGQQHKIAKLLVSHPDYTCYLNETSESGSRPVPHTQHAQIELNLAVLEGYQDVVKILLAKGANVNGTDGMFAALHIAVMTKNCHILDILLQNDANACLATTQGNTALHTVAETDDCVLAQRLIQAGAKVNAVGNEDKTPLHVSCLHGSGAVMKLLVQHGGRVNMEDHYGNTPLHYAASRGHAQMAASLISHGAKVEAVNCNGYTSLHKACSCENAVSALEVLIKQGGAKVNQEGGPQTLRKLPLQISAESGHLNMIKKLLEFGADLSQRDISSQENALFWAVRKDHIHAVDYLLSQGINVNIVNQPDGCTPLHVACMCSNPKIVHQLLKYGADESVQERNMGETALHMAVRNEHYQIVEAFIAADVNLNYTDWKGNTAVMVYDDHNAGKLKIQNMLINNGCSVNNVNNKGDTLLHIAVRNHKYNLAVKLLQGGCDGMLRNNIGESVLSLSKPARYITDLNAVRYAKDCFHDEDARLKLIMTLFAAGESSKSFFDGTRPLSFNNVRLKNKQLCDQAIQYAILKHSMENEVPSLYDYCTLQLRHHLVQRVNGAIIFRIVDSLPLPKSVKEHLLLNDLAWRSAVI